MVGCQGGKPYHAAWAHVVALMQGREVSVRWVPAHGRHEEWDGPQWWRDLNAKADGEANSRAQAARERRREERRSQEKAKEFAGLAIRQQVAALDLLYERYPLGGPGGEE